MSLSTYIIIGVLDVSYILIVMASYIADIFQYMNKFYFSIFKITYKFHEGKLLAEIPAFYLDFNDYFCDFRSNMEFKEICDRYDTFYNGSIVYLSLTLFNFILIIYNLIHLASLILEWRQRFILSLGCSHYLYPIIHSISILSYLWTIKYYSLSPPSGFNSDFNISAQAGLFLMYFAQVVSVLSLFIYLFSRNEATGNESFVEETNEDGYQKIEDKPDMKKLPVLKVSQVFGSDSDDSSGEKSREVFRKSNEKKERISKNSGKSAGNQVKIEKKGKKSKSSESSEESKESEEDEESGSDSGSSDSS